MASFSRTTAPASCHSLQPFGTERLQLPKFRYAQKNAAGKKRGRVAVDGTP